MLLPGILLQKPSRNSKAKEHSQNLEYRLDHWMEGKMYVLIKKCKIIQKNLLSCKRRTIDDTARIFSKLVFQGKINAALKFLSTENDFGVLAKTDEVLKELQTKHPEPSPIQPNTLLNGPSEYVTNNYFDSIDELTVKTSAKLTKGAAGPSHFDSDQCRHRCCYKT